MNKDEWIPWNIHPVPNDVKGILIKYDIGVFCDRYDEQGQRIYKSKEIIGWKFTERRTSSDKSIQCEI